MLGSEGKRDMHRQIVYANTFTSHVSEAVDQPIGLVCGFLQIWETEELNLQSEITGNALK